MAAKKGSSKIEALTALPGVGAATAKKLVSAKIDTVGKLASAGVKKIEDAGVSAAVAKKISAAAKAADKVTGAAKKTATKAKSASKTSAKKATAAAKKTATKAKGKAKDKAKKHTKPPIALAWLYRYYAAEVQRRSISTGGNAGSGGAGGGGGGGPFATTGFCEAKYEASGYGRLLVGELGHRPSADEELGSAAGTGRRPGTARASGTKGDKHFGSGLGLPPCTSVLSSLLWYGPRPAL